MQRNLQDHFLPWLRSSLSSISESSDQESSTLVRAIEDTSLINQLPDYLFGLFVFHWCIQNRRCLYNRNWRPVWRWSTMEILLTWWGGQLSRVCYTHNLTTSTWWLDSYFHILRKRLYIHHLQWPVLGTRCSTSECSYQVKYQRHPKHEDTDPYHQCVPTVSSQVRRLLILQQHRWTKQRAWATYILSFKRC